MVGRGNDVEFDKLRSIGDCRRLAVVWMHVQRRLLRATSTFNVDAEGEKMLQA